ncbi:hypothetical protein ABGB07_36260 [Micromonosporaceae bacterium B7E4]
MTSRDRGVPAQQPAGTTAPPAGVWLGASHALRRPVPVDEPYPHICQARPTSPLTGKPVRLDDRNCAACWPAWVPKPAGNPCAAGCGWPFDPAAAAGGHDRHPGCDGLATVIRPDWGNHDQQTRRTA